MLENVPHWFGSMLRNVRAGHAKLTIVDPDLALPDATLDLTSPAYANGARLPERFTADGDGVSPPLVWRDPPEGTAGFALIVEDPDAPFPQPAVHGLVWHLPADARHLPEGAIAKDGDHGPDGSDVGLNTRFAEGWLPPDPPNGHGSHDYVFQLFALRELIDIGSNPGRSTLTSALEGRVLAAGLLIGTYSRGEEADIGPVGAVTAPA
jgi:Raf kinase inhibitor-like YbhB/YbcL family protein